MPLMVTKHERCVCGHCRCDHRDGFGDCTQCIKCRRYTWPGAGADVPTDHRPGHKFGKPRARKKK